MSNCTYVDETDDVKVVVENDQEVIIIEKGGVPGAPGENGTSFVGKAGVISGDDFEGNPKKFSVNFSTAYATEYSVIAFGTESRSWSYENKSSEGFTINTNANTAISGEVSWMTSPIGET